MSRRVRLRERIPCRRSPIVGVLTWSSTWGCAWAVIGILAGGMPPVVRSAQAQPADSARAAASESVIAAIEAAGRALRAGAFDDAAARLAPHADAPDAWRLLGRLAERQGRYDEALTWWGRASALDPVSEAALERALLLVRLGRAPEAREPLALFLELDRDQAPQDLLARIGRAAAALGQFRLANAVFRQAGRGGEAPGEVEAAWGRLLLEKHNRADALRSFRAALEKAPDLAAAHLGVALAAADTNPPQAIAAATRTLDRDASLNEARVLLARLALDDRQPDQAALHIAEALAQNPRDLDALALRAAMRYLDDDEAGFEAAVREVLAIHPAYAEAYRSVAALLAARYRFDEAAALARRGIALDASHAASQAELGMHLLRTGDEPGARRALEAAFALDPYDVVTFNLLALLDTLDRYEVIERGPLVVKLHPDEAALLGDEVVHLAETALGAMSARYGLDVRGPILIELFPQHDHFAVRNLGLPGMVGALGACFGRVVTLDSPRARPPGAFNWKATLWHELAHVVTLQMSAQRVPRWLTEGISVYEERRADASWGRESEWRFANALAAGEIIPLARLNAAFSDPRLISLAYFQASLLVEHLVASRGEPSLHALVRSYAGGIDDEAALDRVLGTDWAALDREFGEFLAARYGDAARVLSASKEEEGGGAGEPAAGGAYRREMEAGRRAREAGDRAAARAAFERAVALVPFATGQDSARLALAALLTEDGDAAGALAQLEAYLGIDGTALEPARQLAALATARGEARLARLAYERLATVWPYEAESHAALARLTRTAGDAAAALAHLERALLAGPTDRAGTHTEHAEILLAVGRPAEAKRAVMEALVAAPRYERALDLLLRIVDGGEP